MLRAKKSLGQNFLMHQATAERIADAAGLTQNDTVVEIGPGTGMLTRALLARVSKVLAIEADETLVNGLHTTFTEEIASGKLLLIHGDIRSFTPEAHHLGSSAYHVVANIPYYITGEIIRQFLTSTIKPASMTLLVQKEVAVRIARDKKESLLSLSVKAYGTPRYVFTVSRGSFIPAPKVDSAVLSITHINQQAFTSTKEEQWFFEVLRAGFAHKRKLLAGNLTVLASLPRVHKAMQAADISLKARAETVTLPAWRTLARMLTE